jgi:hypothetical protein
MLTRAASKKPLRVMQKKSTITLKAWFKKKGSKGMDRRRLFEYRSIYGYWYVSISMILAPMR